MQNSLGPSFRLLAGTSPFCRTTPPRGISPQASAGLIITRICSLRQSSRTTYPASYRRTQRFSVTSWSRGTRGASKPWTRLVDTCPRRGYWNFFAAKRYIFSLMRGLISWRWRIMILPPPGLASIPRLKVPSTLTAIAGSWSAPVFRRPLCLLLQVYLPRISRNVLYISIKHTRVVRI